MLKEILIANGSAVITIFYVTGVYKGILGYVELYGLSSVRNKPMKDRQRLILTAK